MVAAAWGDRSAPILHYKKILISQVLVCYFNVEFNVEFNLFATITQWVINVFEFATFTFVMRGSEAWEATLTCQCFTMTVWTLKNWLRHLYVKDVKLFKATQQQNQV